MFEAVEFAASKPFEISTNDFSFLFSLFTSRFRAVHGICTVNLRCRSDGWMHHYMLRNSPPIALQFTFIFALVPVNGVRCAI